MNRSTWRRTEVDAVLGGIALAVLVIWLGRMAMAMFLVTLAIGLIWTASLRRRSPRG